MTSPDGTVQTKKASVQYDSWVWPIRQPPGAACPGGTGELPINRSGGAPTESAFASVNEDRIGKIATTLQLPNWLVEALIIEYLPCRRFFEGIAVVLFDFGLVQADDVRALMLPAAVLGNLVLFHNVIHDVIARRMLSGFVGLPMSSVRGNRA